MSHPVFVPAPPTVLVEFMDQLISECGYPSHYRRVEPGELFESPADSDTYKKWQPYFCGIVPPDLDDHEIGTLWHEVKTGQVYEWGEFRVAGQLQDRRWLKCKPQPAYRFVGGGPNGNIIIGVIRPARPDEPLRFDPPKPSVRKKPLMTFAQLKALADKE